MMKFVALPLVAAIALAGCSGTEDAAADGEVTGEEVAAMASDMEKPQPGQYQTKIELLEFNIPGMGEAEVQQMRGFFEGALTAGNSFCLTPEEAEKGWEQMVDEMAEADCTFQKFQAGGSSLDVEATCKGDDGVEGKMKLAGTTSATSSSMTMEMEQAVPDMPGQGVVTMKMKMDSSRTGDCA